MKRVVVTKPAAPSTSGSATRTPDGGGGFVNGASDAAPSQARVRSGGSGSS